jgi:hypothetical protein
VPYAWHGLTPTQWLHELLDVVGSQPPGHGLRQCPAHHDTHPSLSLTQRPDGAARLRCFAGCHPDEILQALRCGRRQLYHRPAMPPARFARYAKLRPDFPPVALRRGHPAGRGYRLESVHTYDPADRTRHRVQAHRLLRWRLPSGGGKELEWETRLHTGETIPGLAGTPQRHLPLYHERQIRVALSVNEPVLVVESESSADALTGWCTTTWAGGASHVNTTRLAQILRGYPHQLLIPDHDPAGLTCLHQLLDAGLGPAVLLGQAGEDARDLHQRHGPDRFTDLVEHLLRAAHTATGPVIAVADRDTLRQISATTLEQPANRLTAAQHHPRIPAGTPSSTRHLPRPTSCSAVAVAAAAGVPSRSTTGQPAPPATAPRPPRTR